MFLTLAQQAGQQGAGSMLTMFLPMILVFVVFYFLLIRPQQKQQKKLQAMIAAVQRGDQVVTRSGIHGKVSSVDDGTIQVEIANNVNVKMNKDQVALVKAANQ